jgi:hypothetical protein
MVPTVARDRGRNEMAKGLLGGFHGNRAAPTETKGSLDPPIRPRSVGDGRL